MSSPGAWVIEHVEMRGAYLSPQGWVRVRSAAYSFDTEAQGAAWLEGMRSIAPKLVGSAAHKVVERPLPDEALRPSGVVTDWNPYGALA